MKYHEDRCYDNRFYSQIGAVTCEELYKLEISFIELLDFNLYVSPEIFYHQFQNCLSQEVGIEEMEVCYRLKKNLSQSSIKTVESLGSIEGSP